MARCVFLQFSYGSTCSMNEDTGSVFWQNFQAQLEHEFDIETGILMDHLPIGVAVASTDSIVRYVNSVFAGWLGLLPTEIVGRTTWDSIFTEASDIDLMRARFSSCLNFGSYDWFTVVLKHKDGSHFKMRTRGSLEEVHGTPVIIGLCEPC